jgi:chromosome segregation ATPase
MSKRKDKKKDEPVVPEKYYPENQLENLGDILLHKNDNENLLKTKLVDLDSRFDKMHHDHITNTEKLNTNLNEKRRENAYLNEEIREIRDEKESFEKNLKENFEKKFEEVQEEKKNAIEQITEEMNELKEDLEIATGEKDELLEKVKKLETEIQRLNHVNNITIHNYENKIRDLNTKHHNKIKNTTERFENFLKNNQELLDNDLYTVYRNLKLKFEKKLKECVDYKKQNTQLEEKNREFKLDMDNNEDIINECAKEQLETKKKTLKLQEELQKKNKIIDLMKKEYQEQVGIINSKFSQILKENYLEIQNLKNEIEDKNKKIQIAQQNSKEVINSRSELELFFIDQLKECRKEIIKKRKREFDKKNCYLPYLNKNGSIDSRNTNNPNITNVNNSSTMTQDDSIYVTSVRKVDIKDMDPESKEKLLRSLLIKLNEGGIAKGFKKLRNEIK